MTEVVTMDEDQQGDASKERIEKLGFKPQKENQYNKLLPYADQLDNESLQLLSSIKANLGRAVLMRELRPGCGLWTARLSRCVACY